MCAMAGHAPSGMPFIRLRALTVEEHGDRLFALFELSQEPTSSWITRFEKCLAKHASAAVVVVGRRIRATLPSRADLDTLPESVQRCIDDPTLEPERSKS